MENEFTTARAKKNLTKFMAELEELQKLLDESNIGKDECDERVKDIQQRAKKEISRWAAPVEDRVELAFYEPALQEGLLYIERYFEAESSEEAFSALYDSSFSIGYYLDQLET